MYTAYCIVCNEETEHIEGLHTKKCNKCRVTVDEFDELKLLEVCKTDKNRVLFKYGMPELEIRLVLLNDIPILAFNMNGPERYVKLREVFAEIKRLSANLTGVGNHGKV